MTEFHPKTQTRAANTTILYTCRHFAEKTEAADRTKKRFETADTARAYAKQVTLPPEGSKTGAVKYYISVGKSLKARDPFKTLKLPYGIKEHYLADRVRWAEVDKKTFLMYLRYLDTGNRAYLLNTDRAL